MDEMLPFLRAIAERPLDDARRLVFADWLDEHDHHERASFIRLQIELARMDAGHADYPAKTAQMRRCGIFTANGQHRFFDYLPTKKCLIAFRRGFIEAIDTNWADRIDTSGLDLVPLLTLRTERKSITKFKDCKHLQWLEYNDREATPARLLEILGPKGWFKNLEELSLPSVNAECLAAGVIPQFDLPKLRNFVLTTPEFFDLGVPVEGAITPDDDDYYNQPRPWGGLPDYLPKNAIPRAKTLERFVWHADEDSDTFNEEDWYWRGPTMESLFACLTGRPLKQVEVAVDHDDHENGGEGIIAAPYEKSPLQLAPTLECVTVNDANVALLRGAKHKIKSLRIYAEDFNDHIFAVLQQPVCSQLETLHIENRYGYWDKPPENPPAIVFGKLRSLCVRYAPAVLFANCQFPQLRILEGFDLKAIQERRWPNLQTLRVGIKVENMSDLRRFALADCCPNLTTLTVDGYFDPAKVDFSFLADCPHMPHLSLIRIPGYPMERAYIVDDGQLLPVRSDIVLDDWQPRTEYRISVVF